MASATPSSSAPSAGANFPPEKFHDSNENKVFPWEFESPLLRKNAKKAWASATNLEVKRTKTLRAKSENNSVNGSTSSVPREEQDVNCRVFDVEERGSKRWIRLEVSEPVTITAKNFLHFSTTFTSYLIRIETNHYAFSLPFSEVRRRYSEFCWLRQKLAHHHPNKQVPPLPPKHFFNMTNFNERVINERRFGLGKFLQRVFRSSVLLSDSALHLFLQTDLSVREIEERVSEEGKGSFRVLKGPMTKEDGTPSRKFFLSRSVSSEAESGCGFEGECDSSGSGSVGDVSNCSDEFEDTDVE